MIGSILDITLKEGTGEERNLDYSFQEEIFISA